MLHTAGVDLRTARSCWACPASVSSEYRYHNVYYRVRSTINNSDATGLAAQGEKPSGNTKPVSNYKKITDPRGHEQPCWAHRSHP